MNNFEYAQKLEEDLKQEFLLDARTIQEKEYIRIPSDNTLFEYYVSI